MEGTVWDVRQMLAGLFRGLHRKPAIFGVSYKTWRTKVFSGNQIAQMRPISAVDLHLTLPSQMKNCRLHGTTCTLEGFLVLVHRCCSRQDTDMSCSIQKVHAGLKVNAGLFSELRMCVCPPQLIFISLSVSALLH